LYLGNGASNHMCGDIDKYMELNESIQGNVIFINHLKVFIKGKCMILIKLKNRSHQFNGDVYCIPIVKSNILSLR
jgi:hypothetical protein